MKRRVLLIVVAILMTLVMGSFVVHADDSGTVKLTIHWSSVDGLDLMDPIVIDGIEPGTTITNACSSSGLDFNGTLYEKSGYVDWGYTCSVPITSLTSWDDVHSNPYYYNYRINEDTVAYRLMFKELDTLELTMISPVCGESTTTTENPDGPPWAKWDYANQTNIPKFTIPSGANYVLNIGPMFPGAIWVTKETALNDDPYDFNIYAPYIGAFKGEQDYYAEVWVKCDFGYTFPEKPTIKINNGTLTWPCCDGDYYGVFVKVTADHKLDAGKVTKAPTMTAEGEFTYTCSTCGGTKTEKIAKLSSPDNLKPGADEKAAEAAILALPNDKDPAGSEFGTLQLKAAKTTKNSIKLTWKKASGAAKYMIYANACGKGNKYKKLTTVTGTSYTVKQAAGAKLKKGKYYKFLMVAVNASGKVVSTSKTVHAATLGGKVGNDKKVTTKAKKNKVTVKAKKTFKLAAKTVAASKKLKVKKHRAVSYETSNAKVATVSAKGVIKGIKKGTCKVYAYAQNGVCAVIKVTVK